MIEQISAYLAGLGINFPLIEAYTSNFARGLVITLGVSLLSLFLATIVGLFGAWGSLAGSRLANGFMWLYTNLVRTVPNVLLLFWVYYGGQGVLNWIVPHLANGADILFGKGAASYLGLTGAVGLSPFLAAVLTLGFFFGAFMAETFRGAYLAIPKGQIEAGLACGMSKWCLFRRIIAPQLIYYALPSFGNNWQVLLKDTAIVSFISLGDVVKRVVDAGRSTNDPFLFMLLLLALFLGLTLLSEWFFKKVYKRYGRGMGVRA